jgi:hypothetical protein
MINYHHRFRFLTTPKNRSVPPLRAVFLLPFALSCVTMLHMNDYLSFRLPKRLKVSFDDACNVYGTTKAVMLRKLIDDWSQSVLDSEEAEFIDIEENDNE